MYYFNVPEIVTEMLFLGIFLQLAALYFFWEYLFQVLTTITCVLPDVVPGSGVSVGFLIVYTVEQSIFNVADDTLSFFAKLYGEDTQETQPAEAAEDTAEAQPASEDTS